MNIQTVKYCNGGYIVNGVLNIPNDPKNADYNLVQQWILDGGIVEDQFTLEELKKNKISQLQENKKSVIYAPITYNGNEFVNSEIASANINGYYTFADEPVEWLDLYGNEVILTKAQLGELGAAIVAYRSSIYFQEASKIAAINACTTTEELEAINIEFTV